MTVTETQPVEGQLATAPPADTGQVIPEPLPPAGIGGLVGTADHKVVGRAYLICSLVFLGAALVLATLASAEGIDLSRLEILGTESFFQVFTLSWIGIAFLGVLPAFLGLALFVVPLQVGSPSVAFPRAAAASFWAWLLGSGLLIGSYAINGGPGGGRLEGVLLTFAAWGMIILALLTAAICVVTTVIALRVEGLSLLRVPAFSWSMLVAGSVWLLSLPVLAGNLLIIYVDTDHDDLLFGQPANVWPQLRWFLTQPAVFALAIPVLGIAADVVATHARQRVKAHPGTLVGIGLFGALSFGPWAQQAFNPRLVHQALYVVMSFAIILPTLVTLGGLADTLRRGKPRLASALPLAILSVLAVLVAALAGAVGAISGLNLQGTAWSDGVAKLVVGACVLSLAAAVSYWGPKMWGHLLTDALGKLNVLVLLAGTALFGAGELIAGGVGQAPPWPSGIPDEVKSGAEFGFALSAIGAALLTLGVVLVLLQVLQVMTGRGREAGADPWEGYTLEWATASPPPYQNFEGELPAIRSPWPLYDARQPAEEVS
jgi:cytochrome c oxidase subunit 1